MHVKDKAPDDNSIDICPNPAYEQLQVTWKDASQSCPGLIQLYDADGRMVQQQTVQSITTIVSTGHLPQGLYTVNVMDCNGNRLARNVIKLNR